MENYSGYDLFARFQKGDSRALSSIYEQYHFFVELNTVVLPNGDLGKELIINDTFLKAWDRRSTFQSIDHFERWLKVVATRASISRLRSIASEKKKIGGASLLFENIESAVPSEEEHTILHQRLSGCITALAPISRMIIVAAFWDEKSNSEIANQLNLTVNAVVARKSRALKFLRSQMVNPEF